ncbi:hypothetical protein DFQ28_011304 [Apophysomyces sp. BC1034]|nr:hypothetical protein DFQ30_011101 [Apophysomyces sp. BC1015]KAG0169350.1 hypothetical protein DFQ29_009733 [Apophysomyces sp. BC1021]KAG0184375.1 hypothetical protein DFQ28_011304 [Apophysomyces sp. BC1034]
MNILNDSKLEYSMNAATAKTYSTEEKQIDGSIIAENYVKLEYNIAGQAEYEISPAERRLVRKLDFIYVMPFVAVLNFLQPINAIAIQRLPLAKYLSVIIVLWGLVLLMTYKSQNFSQLAALRFLLGFLEAGVYPCCIVLLSTLYRRKEQAGRIGVVYICNGVAMTFGSLIGYGIGHMQGLGGLAAWQWMMIILGSVTIIFGCFTFFFLVDTPKSRFLHLTKEEEQIVNDRMLDNKVVRTKEVKKSHMWESLKEPRFYSYIMVSLLLSLQNGALSTFTGIITKGFGFDNLTSILLAMPGGVMDCLYIVLAVWINRKYGHTLYTASILLVCAMTGLILLVAIPLERAKLLGLYLSWGYAAAYTLVLVSVANNVAGYTKKIFYSSCMMVFYTVGNFCGALLMLPNEYPHYTTGMIVYIVCDGVSIALLLIARYYMAKSNRVRLENPSAVLDNKDLLADDLTDRENPDYIYRL